jgi:hypothetical protein
VYVRWRNKRRGDRESGYASASNHVVAIRAYAESDVNRNPDATPDVFNASRGHFDANPTAGSLGY